MLYFAINDVLFDTILKSSTKPLMAKLKTPWHFYGQDFFVKLLWIIPSLHCPSPGTWLSLPGSLTIFEPCFPFAFPGSHSFWTLVDALWGPIPFWTLLPYTWIPTIISWAEFLNPIALPDGPMSVALWTQLWCTWIPHLSEFVIPFLEILHHNFFRSHYSYQSHYGIWP